MKNTGIDPTFGKRQAQKLAKAAGGPLKKTYDIEKIKADMRKKGLKKQIVPGFGVVEIDIKPQPVVIEKTEPVIVEKKEKKEVK